MFSFLNSAVLLAAAAALIPLILHLFSKRRVKVVEFSSLKHLKQMQKRQVRRLKIRQLLLLLLRMLIILAVVLAFARPTTEGGNIGSHAEVSAVVVVDNSASMQRYVADGVLYDLAVERTEELLATFSESDDIAVVPTVPLVEVETADVFTSAAVALEKLRRLAASDLPGDMEQALDRAGSLLETAANLNKELYIISDRQRSALPEAPLLAETGANVYILDLPLEENDNAGILTVDFGGQLILPGHDFDITATLKNYSGEARDDLIVSLFLDGTRVAQTDAVVGAGEQAAVRFSRSVSRAGLHSGYVELSDDAFPGDNRWYFSFTIPEQFNVLIINDDPASRLMSLALSPSPDMAQYWSVKIAATDELSGINVFDYDAIFLSGIPRLPQMYVDRLKAFVRNGRSLFLSYGAGTPLDQYNAVWAPVTGVSIDEPIDPDFTRAGYYTLADVDIDHPVFNVFSFDQNQPPEIKFYTLPTVSAGVDANVIAGFSGNRPALVESSLGRGRILTWLAPMAPQYNDLAGHSFFVPFVSRIAEYLASGLSSYDMTLFSGQTITRSVELSGGIDSPVEMETPDSLRVTLPPEEQQGALVVRARPINRPGIYHLYFQGREIDRFAVNINPTECNLTAVDADQFADALGAPQAPLLEEDVALAGAVAELRFGKELWQVFLWVAAILMALEMLLSRSGRTEQE